MLFSLGVERKVGRTNSVHSAVIAKGINSHYCRIVGTNSYWSPKKSNTNSSSNNNKSRSQIELLSEPYFCVSHIQPFMINTRPEPKYFDNKRTRIGSKARYKWCDFDKPLWQWHFCRQLIFSFLAQIGYISYSYTFTRILIS